MREDGLAAIADSDGTMWLAVAKRDASSDGLFVYAVKTTGVYCRPSCPSRRPKRSNVLFFALNREAEAAGFRSCLRCRPSATSIAHAHHAAIERACREIEAAQQMPTLESLAPKAGMSQSHFRRVFKRVTGTTPKAYAKALSDRRIVSEMSGARNRTVTEAVFAAGYNSLSRFYEGAEQRLGMAPRMFHEGGQGADIHFGIVPSWLGLVLVAATAKGICSVRFGEDGDALERELRSDFPNANIQPDGGDFEQLLAAVVGAIDQPAEAGELALDIQGTLFEQKVWAALRKIPCGETRSYSQIAKMIGQPQAARAVARACAANPVAVLTPCHRVIAKSGVLSGYRWGTERKAALLKKERDGRE